MDVLERLMAEVLVSVELVGSHGLVGGNLKRKILSGVIGCIFAFLKCVTSVGHVRLLPWPGKPSDMVLLLWFVVVLMACVARGHLLVTTNTWKRKSQTRPPYLQVIGQYEESN